MSKLYVGNIPYSVDDQALQDHFAACGTVTSARVITDKGSGRSKGFGFVEMSSADEANAAIEQLNGKELQGRAIRVSEAKPQESGGGRGGGGGFKRGGPGGGRGGGFNKRY